jgi:Zn-dependent protease
MAPTFGQKLKKFLGPLGVVGVLIAKFFAKVKFLIFPLAKYGWLILKTGGTMLLSVWAYALFWGVWFAAGFVVLMFVHECGHLLAAKKVGLKVGAPVFIPFMGALIALKEAPRNAWIEAQVGSAVRCSEPWAPSCANSFSSPPATRCSRRWLTSVSS